jgi:hypothetical protein
MTALEDLPTFDLDAVPAFYGAAEVAAARDASAELTRDYRLRRRDAKRILQHKLNIANAAQQLQALPAEGESLHCVMRGNYHAWDLVPAVLRLAAPAVIDYLAVATLGFNRSNAAELLELIDAGRVARCDFICSCYFRSTSADEFGFLASGLQARGQRIAALRSHAKIVLFAMSDGAYYAIESSANLRSCHNVEQFSMTRDRALFDFHREWMGSLLEQS